MGFFSSLARSLSPSHVVQLHKDLNPVKVTKRVGDRIRVQQAKHGEHVFHQSEKYIFRGRGPGWAVNWRKHASQLTGHLGAVGGSYDGGYITSRRQGASPGTAFRRELRNFGRSAAAITVVYGGIAAAGGSAAGGGSAAAGSAGASSGASGAVAAGGGGAAAAGGGGGLLGGVGFGDVVSTLGAAEGAAASIARLTGRGPAGTPLYSETGTGTGPVDDSPAAASSDWSVDSALGGVAKAGPFIALGALVVALVLIRRKKS